MDHGGTADLTVSEKSELIRLVRKTMGEGHPTGERLVSLIKHGHIPNARRALEESIEGLEALIEMDKDEDADEMTADDETKEGDQTDLDKYRMLLEAIPNG
jgi:hypothetical protein